MTGIVAVVGGRDFTDYAKLVETLDAMAAAARVPIVEIVSGGATGADTLAARYANEHDVKLTTFLPDWSLYGKRAGAMRNQLIVNATDQVVAFWDGKSPGTKITIDMAKRANKVVTVVTF